MKNKELQQLLAQYPDDMPVKLLFTHETPLPDLQDFEEENILHTSATAHANADAPEDEWDSEDGKIELGDGEQFLVINPLIV